MNNTIFNVPLRIKGLSKKETKQLYYKNKEHINIINSVNIQNPFLGHTNEIKNIEEYFNKGNLMNNNLEIPSMDLCCAHYKAQPNLNKNVSEVYCGNELLPFEKNMYDNYCINVNVNYVVHNKNIKSYYLKNKTNNLINVINNSFHNYNVFVEKKNCNPLINSNTINYKYASFIENLFLENETKMLYYTSDNCCLPLTTSKINFKLNDIHLSYHNNLQLLGFTHSNTQQEYDYIDNFLQTYIGDISTNKYNFYKTFNIWVVETNSNIMGCYSLPLNGIILNYKIFENEDLYNIALHQIGHYFGLKHVAINTSQPLIEESLIGENLDVLKNPFTWKDGLFFDPTNKNTKLHVDELYNPDFSSFMNNTQPKYQYYFKKSDIINIETDLLSNKNFLLLNELEFNALYN